MIDYPTYCEVQRLYRQEGLSVGQIADKLNLCYQTVDKWAKRASYQKAQSPPRSSKLDAYKDQVVAWLERHPFSAQQVLQKLKELGYDGQYGIVKQFVRRVRPVRKPAYLMLKFAPGECAQVDWGSYGSMAVGSTHRRLSFFVMVLCHSRRMYVEFTLSEGMEQFLSCHRRALEYFDGTPARIMIDYVARNIINLLFPVRICAMTALIP